MWDLVWFWDGPRAAPPPASSASAS
eukprot:SAG31_NODE_21594_length_545_cov_1.921525_1_plen_24_part_10